MLDRLKEAARAAMTPGPDPLDPIVEAASELAESNDPAIKVQALQVLATAELVRATREVGKEVGCVSTSVSSTAYSGNALS